jgi:hypothetical protein
MALPDDIELIIVRMLQVPGESMEEGQRRQFFSLACSSSATTKATSAPGQQIRRMKKL